MLASRVVVHCTATPNGREYTVEQCNADHVARGWKKIGYHGLIAPDGEFLQGRGLNEQGAHAGGKDNVDSLGIALVGLDKFSQNQFNTLRRTLDSWRMIYPIKPWSILCHYELDGAKAQGKTCPNLDKGRLLTWYFLELEEAISPYVLR